MTAHAVHRSRAVTVDRMPSVVLGTALFVASECVFFSVLFGAWFTVRSRSPQWPPAGIPDVDPALGAIATGVLILSSLGIYLARSSVRGGRRRSMIRFMWLTMALGALALALQGWDISHVGFTVQSSGFGTVYWMTSVIDSAHVLGALIFLLLVLRLGHARVLTAANHAVLDACTIFWHFVVIASIFTFLVLELVT